MKKNKILYPLLCFIVLLLSCNAEKETADTKFRFIHNNDGSDLLGNRWFGGRPLTIEDLNACVDMIADSPVTTYMMCTGSDFFYYRSKYGRTFGDDRNGTLKCGDDSTAYHDFKKYYDNHLRLEKEGTDLIQATLNRAKEKGMEAFITYRMNDLHFADTAMPCLIHCPDFWMEHKEYWLRDSTQGYHSEGALNFAIEEVRKYKYDVICEQLERYEMIDGFELDFMRFIVYFHADSGQYYAPLMTDLVKKVRKKVDEVSAERGKKILLAVRVPITLEACSDKGLDIKDWIQQGLIDFLTIGVHWTGDPAMPVRKFREDFGTEIPVPVYATIDDGGFRPREFYSHGMIRGAASHALAQGADGIYLFNYYLSEYVAAGKKGIPEEGGMVCRIRTTDLLQETGHLKTLEGRNKTYSLSDGRPQYKVKPVTSLPLRVTPEKTSQASVFIGDRMQTRPEEVIMFLRTNNPASLEIKVNGTSIKDQKAAYTTLYDRNRGLKDEEKEYAYLIPADAIKYGDNEISFRTETDAYTVTRLDVTLKYGDVKTHGYF